MSNDNKAFCMRIGDTVKIEHRAALKNPDIGIFKGTSKTEQGPATMLYNEEFKNHGILNSDITSIEVVKKA